MTTIGSRLLIAGAMSLIGGCAPGEPGMQGDTPGLSQSAAPDHMATADEPASYEAGLQWMLDKAAYGEDRDVPCLLRPPPRPAWVKDRAAGTRLREARSDSYWLGQWARDNLGERLAYATITYDWDPVRGQAPPKSPPPLIYEIAVTGSEKVNPPPLGARAKSIPIVVLYNVPVSAEEFSARRTVGRPIAQRLLDTTGEGGSPETNWFVRLSVFSEDGAPDVAALKHCDALRRAYRLPVLMEFSSARLTLD